MRRVPIRAPLVALTLLMAPAACGSGADVTQQLDTLQSWTSTMQLTSAEHRSGALTDRYVAQLSEGAKQALAEARRSLAQTEHDSSEARRADAAVDSLDRAIRALDAELRR